MNKLSKNSLPIKKLNILENYLEKKEKAPGVTSGTWMKVSFWIFLYLFLLIIQVPGSLRGGIAQLESIITIILALRFARTGFWVGVVLNLLNIIFLSTIILVTHNFDPMTGIIVSFFTLITISIIAALVKRNAFRFSEVVKQKEEIQKLNSELEMRVRKRTAQLELANKELEAFSYSVSHDLRAPLRALNGYSHILVEDYGRILDEEGRSYLAHINNASVHMSLLIDDILKLSHIARSEMNFEPVDLGAISTQILNDLRSGQPSRSVRLNISPDLWVKADHALMQIALSNLLSNAWKFTGKVIEAEISVGVVLQDNQPVYYVSDNGAGFDMTYHNKLFLPFQRLHSEQDFEGTGIGLAIVQRIIQRHGGRIWAESELDKGATFRFTLFENQS